MIKLLKEYMNKKKSTSIMAVDEVDDKSTQRYRLRKLNEELKAINEEMKLVIPILDSACGKYVKLLNELIEEKNQQAKQQATYQDIKPSKRKKKNIKKLYNKIANECHPDKNDDEESHKRFRDAKKAIEDGDDLELFNIYKELFGDANEEEFFDLDSKLVSLEMELMRVKSTNRYKIVTIYNSGDTKTAKQLYLKVIMETIQQYEMELI